MRILGIDVADADTVWHVTAYGDFFPDLESAESAAENIAALPVEIEHVALTNRAFLSTQVARLGNQPLSRSENERLTSWIENPVVTDRSIRLLLGIR